jgi:hypothetical protein
MYVDGEIRDATKKNFWTSHEICVDDLSARSFRDPTKNGRYHGSSRWFSTLPSVSKHFKQKRDKQLAPVHFTAQRGRQR